MDDYLTRAFQAIQDAVDSLGAGIILAYEDGWSLSLWKPLESGMQGKGRALHVEHEQLAGLLRQTCSDLGLTVEP